MNKYTLIFAIFLMATLFGVVAVVQDNDLQMAKAGLEQCVVTNPDGMGVNIVWRKECKN